jgi:hypothetical protein
MDKQVSLLNERYKAVVESDRLGVKIIITVQADGMTPEDEKEAIRKAKVIADHFEMVVGKA